MKTNKFFTIIFAGLILTFAGVLVQSAETLPKVATVPDGDLKFDVPKAVQEKFDASKAALEKAEAAFAMAPDNIDYHRNLIIALFSQASNMVSIFAKADLEQTRQAVRLAERAQDMLEREKVYFFGFCSKIHGQIGFLRHISIEMIL